jgi:hypothetical protein
MVLIINTFRLRNAVTFCKMCYAFGVAETSNRRGEFINRVS